MRNTVTRDHYGPCRSHKPTEPINYTFRILVSSLRAGLDRSGRAETISVWETLRLVRANMYDEATKGAHPGR